MGKYQFISVPTLRTYLSPTFDLASTHRSSNSANARGTSTGWAVRSLVTRTSSLSSFTSSSTSTASGPNAGVEMESPPFEFISAPVADTVTISGSIQFNVWGYESASDANAGPQVIVEKVAATDYALTTIINSESGVEFGTTNPPTSAISWFDVPASSVVVNKGDRIRVRLLANDAGGNMATGRTFTIVTGTGGTSNGSTWVSTAESVRFHALSTPGGSKLFLTDDAASGSINPGSAIEKDMWTSRGSGVVTKTTKATSAGWTSGFQATDGDGGSAIEWYSRPLAATTLSGIAKLLIRAKSIYTCSVKAELAVCDGDGTNATVWGIGYVAPYEDDNNRINQYGALSSFESACVLWLAGVDTAIENGKRLRLRVFLDDAANQAISNGATCDFLYASTTADDSGDSFLVLPQTVTEYP